MIIGTMRAEEARVHDTWEGYHRFHAETPDGVTYGSFEIFWNDGSLEPEFETDHDPAPALGWYWWACFPGCLPDGEPTGPFATSRQALEDADEWNPEFDDA